MSTRLEGAKYRALQTATLRAEYGYDMVALLNSIEEKTPQSVNGRFPVEPLGVPTESWSETATDVSTYITLTPTCRRISIAAVNGAIRYKVSTTNNIINADEGSHYVLAGERLDFAVPANAVISIIRGGSTNVQVEISELS